MKTQRICITTLEFPPDVGGVGESVDRIAHMLLDLGYEVHVAVFHSKHRKSETHQRSSRETTKQDGIWVHRLQSAIRSSETIMQDYLSEIYFQLKRLHQQFNFEVFHSFFINETGFVTTLLAKEEGIPIINSVRGNDLHKHIFNPKQHGQITWILEQSSWVTFVSQDLQKRGCILVPGLQEKSSAFWNSIKPIDFEQLPSPTLVDKLQGTVIASVGRFRDKKGIEYLLDACAELHHDLELTLLFVGDFAERERVYWEEEIAQSSLRNQIVMTGILSRIEALAYLPHIDIFAIPSLHDGCPNALLEAMLAKRAVVGTTVDAIGEILENGDNGLVINPGSTDELVTALKTLAQSPQLREKLGDAAHKTVQKKLAPQVEQANWQKVYTYVINSSQIHQISNYLEVLV